MKSLLISVHPEHCAKLLTSEKIAELRRTEPKQEFDGRIFIYNTGTKQIEIKAVLSSIIKADYGEIEKRYLKFISITPDQLRQYSHGKINAYLLVFFAVMKLSEACTIEKMLSNGITPPQSYLYFNPEQLGIIEN